MKNIHSCPDHEFTAETPRRFAGAVRLRLKPVGSTAARLLVALVASATLLGPQAAQAQNGTNADIVYQGWLDAYLVRSGGKTFFCNSLTDRSMAFMWGQAYMITGVEDAYEKNHSADRKQLVGDLLDTYLQQNTADLSWDSWNDDVAWAAIALIRGYQITGRQTYLSAATQAFNMAYNRGWDTKYGGGIWENMADKDQASGNKGGLSNWTFVIAGAMIYQSTGDVGYLTKSKAIYAWAHANVVDNTTGRVYEAIGVNGRGGDDNTYNSGLALNAANSLYKLTNDIGYYNDAVLYAQHVINKYPILPEDHPANGDFGADQFVRGLSNFARQNNLWTTYWQYLENNAAAAWNTRRTDSNLSHNNWTTQTDRSNLRAMEAEGSVVVQAVSQISPITGAHVIVSVQNGMTIDNASLITSGAGTVLWGWNGGKAQTWVFSSNADNSWTITSQYSGQVLDDPAYSAKDGTQIGQYPANGGDNQHWWVDQQSDGSYKIWNKSSGRALDTSSATANGKPVVQWAWNGGNQQRWFLK